jgi:hypothetical protein
MWGARACLSGRQQARLVYCSHNPVGLKGAPTDMLIVRALGVVFHPSSPDLQYYEGSCVP